MIRSPHLLGELSNGKKSNWLIVMQISKYHFDLFPIEFKDALALRYHRPLLRMPVCCDGYGAQSSLEHPLNCKEGGLVTQRHNKVHDSLGDIASLVYKDVLREPVVREVNEPRGYRKHYMTFLYIWYVQKYAIGITNIN